MIRKAGGIDTEHYLELLTSTLFIGSPLGVYAQHIAESKFEPGFRMPLALKDMQLTLDASKELHVNLPLVTLLRDQFKTAISHGYGDLDWSALALLAAEDPAVLRPSRSSKTSKIA